MTLGALPPSLARLVCAGAAAGLVMTASCAAHDDNGDRAARRSPDTAHAAPDSARAATAAESIAVARDQWNAAEVVKRLTQAGLVVTDEDKTVHYPGLRHAGQLLKVGESELQIYVYDDAADRRRDGAGLDTTNAGVASIGMPLRPRFILNNNLIALHFTLSDRLAERVHDALMARHRERE